MASPHPAMLWGTAGEECDTRFVVVAVFQPLRPSDTSLYFAVQNTEEEGILDSVAVAVF